MSREQNFWSRRRAAVQAETEAEAAAKEAQALAEEHAALEEQPDEEILAQLNLPDPDSLKQGDDFTAFLAKAVPDRIRTRALRSLWRSNPVLANVDALVEYGEDFTDSALAVENIQTAYQVGKGMLKHVEEMARQAALEDAEDEAEETVPAGTAQIPEENILTAVAEPAEEEPVAEVEEPEDEMPAPPRPARMRFREEGVA